MTLLEDSRVARLATTGKDGRPHVVPVVYALDGHDVVVPLDGKPKRVAPTRLRRVRNVLETGRACFLVDHWSEDWSQLAWIMMDCHATVEEATDRVVALLRDRYPQYSEVGIDAVIRLVPQSVSAWRGESGPPLDNESCPNA